MIDRKLEEGRGEILGFLNKSEIVFNYRSDINFHSPSSNFQLLHFYIFSKINTIDFLLWFFCKFSQKL